MATGMAIMGFGGGAMIATPIKETLLGVFYKAPQYLGAEGAVNLVTEGGRRMAEVSGHMVEVVVASAKQLASAPGPLQEGVYVAGTGNTGAAMTFFTLGIGYFIVMMIAAFSYRVPREGWVPAGWTPPTAEAASRKMITQNDVHIDQALKTPQFYLLWIVLCFNVTAGIGVIGVAKTMMTEIFGTTLPRIVDASFAATYVFMISVFNMVGRFFWASTSDFIGRKNTYHIFFVLGHRPLSVDPVCGAAGQRQSGRDLAGDVLCGDDDHLHHVWRRLRHDSGLSGRYLRDEICRRHPWSPADGLEYGRRARTARHHLPARRLGWQRRSATWRPRSIRRRSRQSSARAWTSSTSWWRPRPSPSPG